MKIGIIDYGAGNLASLANCIRFIGHTPELLSRPDEAADFSHLILPGVGAFGHGMTKLQSLGWDKFIIDYVTSEKGYFLGICLGMQLMCSSAEEGGNFQGLNLVSGSIKKMIPADETEKVPHVGWNSVSITNQCELMRDIPNESDFYFVHSYSLQRVENEQSSVGWTKFSNGFHSIIKANEMTYGVQFHPEKSSKHGLKLLKNFIELR